MVVCIKDVFTVLKLTYDIDKKISAIKPTKKLCGYFCALLIYMRIILLFLFCAVFFGCNKDELKAPDAFFITPSSVSVYTITQQGSSADKITDIWLYVNGSFKGAYPVGKTLPIVSYGHTEIRMFAGIKNNGISTTRQPYEFYDILALDTNVESGKNINKSIVFKYKPNAKFHLTEGFDGGTGGINFQKSINSDTNFTILNNHESMQGPYMYFSMDNTRQVAQFQSTTTYSLPLNGAPVYAEINFKCNQDFELGVYSGYDFRSVLILSASETWNKVYAFLTPRVSEPPLNAYYGLYLKAFKKVDNPQIFIDNIKLISY